MAQDPNKVTLRQQIADTRAGMTDTLDAIQDRVNPRNVVSRAKESFKESTVGRVKTMAQSAGTSMRSFAETAGSRMKSAGSRMKNVSESAGSAAGYVMARTARPREKAMRMAREYPVAAAVIGGAVVFLLVRSLRGRRRGYLYEEAL